MTAINAIRCHVLTATLLVFSASAGAQTLATGDSRTVTEPTYPGVCTTLTAQFTSSQRAAPPSSDDTSRLQTALTNCAGTGKSVVLAASGSKNAFYSNSLNVNGAGLVINSGVTLYGNNSYAGNAQFILFNGSNASLMGPGAVDGRGDILSGSARLVQAKNITNFTVYNVTIKESVFPNLYVEGGNGFTAWKLTIRTPSTRTNADGIDIDSLTNATVANSSIEAGDDGIAVKTNSGDASNITVRNSQLYGTHGLSIGSIYKNTVSNILFKNNYVYGADLSGTTSANANAINIKTGPCALTVSKVSYVNTCITGAKHLVIMDTNYHACPVSGGTPTLSNIVVNGAYATSSVSGAYTRIAGRNASFPVNAYLAHVNLDATAQSGDQYANVGLDSSNDVPSGTGVTTSNFTMSGAVPSCTF